MSTTVRLSSILLGLLFAVPGGHAAGSVLALPADELGDRSSTVGHRVPASDTSDTLAVDPYRTDRSVAYHVLAAPAYLLHGVTRPIGWGMRYLEQEYPELFKPQRRIRGVFPLVELGGPTGFLVGGAFFDRRVFGSPHRMRLEALYGGPDTFDGSALYEVPAPFGPQTNLKAVVNFFSDPRNEFYLGGNESDLDADEAFFSRQQLDVTLGLRASSPSSVLSGGVEVLYEHIDANNLQGGGAADPPGLGTVDLLTSRLLLGVDLTRGRPRTYRGTEVLLQFGYSRDLGADRFQYGRYVGELRQYLPVGLFPKSRRLALRARLEQVGALFGEATVPFYQLPNLGGRRALRGFKADRFQNEGSLLLTAEYRYPIWENLDAVLLVDAGQVFPELSAVAADRFHWSYGGGIHLLGQKGLSFRFEVVGSREGLRTVLTAEPSFQRLNR